MRYIPTLRWPVRGSRVITAGSVMNGPASPGQQVCTGSRPRSTSSPWRTISWQAPRFTTFGRESAIDFSVFSPRTLAASPSGGCSSRISDSLAATSSSDSTPNARHIRRSVPNWLMSSGIALPFGCSNSSAGPPARTVRATISVTSSFGSTAAETRTSSPDRSSRAIHSRRSLTTRPSLVPSRCRCPARSAGRDVRRARAAGRAAAPAPSCSSGAKNSSSMRSEIARSWARRFLPAGLRLTRCRRLSTGSRLRSTRPASSSSSSTPTNQLRS